MRFSAILTRRARYSSRGAACRAGTASSATTATDFVLIMPSPRRRVRVRSTNSTMTTAKAAGSAPLNAHAALLRWFRSSSGSRTPALSGRIRNYRRELARFLWTRARRSVIQSVRKRTWDFEKIVSWFEGWREIAVRIHPALTIGRYELSDLFLRCQRYGCSSG